jgi:exonuclease SbcD
VRLMAFSDIHLDATTAGKARRAEVVEFLASARKIATDEKVDLVVFGGDAHDSGWLADPLFSAELISGIMKFDQPVVAVAGNHDVVDTSELFHEQPVTTLTPLRAAAMFSSRSPSVKVFDRPACQWVSAEWVVLGLPYLSRAHAALNEKWLGQAFKEAQMHVAAGKKLIVVGHLVVPGAVMGSESVEMAKGQDQLFPLASVEALKPALVINGHYHARQVVKLGQLEVVIPGSPLRFTFGEAAEVSKGVCIVEL